MQLVLSAFGPDVRGAVAAALAEFFGVPSGDVTVEELASGRSRRLLQSITVELNISLKLSDTNATALSLKASSVESQVTQAAFREPVAARLHVDLSAVSNATHVERAAIQVEPALVQYKQPSFTSGGGSGGDDESDGGGTVGGIVAGLLVVGAAAGAFAKRDQLKLFLVKRMMIADARKRAAANPAGIKRGGGSSNPMHPVRNVGGKQSSTAVAAPSVTAAADIRERGWSVFGANPTESMAAGGAGEVCNPMAQEQAELTKVRTMTVSEDESHVI
jgi:hypothetical protein